MSEVRKRVRVRPAPAEAFALFTERIGEWWPLLTHSVGAERAVGVAIEPGVGGRIVEHVDDGSTEVWGTIERWEPPALLRFSWHPGNPVDEATIVEVTFEDADGGTVVELVHTGWDRRPDTDRARTAYDTGWTTVLGRFVASSEAVGPS